MAGIVASVTDFVPRHALGRVLSPVIVPMQRATSSAVDWVGGRFTVLTQSEELLAENRALREENIILVAENQRIPLLEYELANFEAMLDTFQRYPQLPMKGARIIGQNPNQWQERFYIDRGENSGIFPHMIVLGDGGVLGKVLQTSRNYALVATIMDSSFSAAVRNVRTEDLGVVSGNIDLRYDGLMRMEFMEAGASFMPGDEIITSSHGAFFPPGVLVGTVIEVRPRQDAAGLMQYAIIEPAVCLDRIDVVLVVNRIFSNERDIDETTDIDEEVDEDDESGANDED